MCFKHGIFVHEDETILLGKKSFEYGMFVSELFRYKFIMNINAKIYIAGHNGLVGSAIVRNLKIQGYTNLFTRSHEALDLCDQAAVQSFFSKEQPEYVFLAAAKVGGILANQTYAAQFLYTNICIQTNVIEAAYQHRVKKLLFLGSSCIYPKECPQPIKETALLTGPLEPTNEWYAIAKIAGIKMCQAYQKQYGFNAISVMPTNIYGPGDTFDLEKSHVVPALIRRFHEAIAKNSEIVTLWGTGTPRREFLYVDDLAQACIFLMEQYTDIEPINIGCGTDITIFDLAQKIAEIVGFNGTIVFDTSKPDGVMQKCLDVSKISELGWFPNVGLEVGLKRTYTWYLDYIRQNQE